MDATQSVNLDGGGEGAQTSAGLNSVNSTGLEAGNSGVLPRAEENSEIRLPTLNIERLDPAMIEGLNALSDEDVFEEARGEINLPEDLAANSAEAAKNKESDNIRKNSALDTQMKRLESTNAPGKTDSSIVPAVRRRPPTLANLESRYKNALDDLDQELLEFFHAFQVNSQDDIPETDRAEANKQWISIRQLRGSLQHAVDKLVPHLEKNAMIQRKNDVKVCLDDIDVKITGINLKFGSWLDSYTEIQEAYSRDGRFPAEQERVSKGQRVISPVLLGDRESNVSRISPRLALVENRVQMELEEEIAEIDNQVRFAEVEDEKRKKLRDIQAKGLKEQAKMNAAQALSIAASEEGGDGGLLLVQNQMEEKEKESGDADYPPWSFYDPGGPTTKQKKYAAEMRVRREEEKIRQQRTSSTTQYATGQTAGCAITAGPSVMASRS